MHVYVFVILMVYCAVCATVTFINVGLLCIRLFSCKAASVLNKLTYLLTSGMSHPSSTPQPQSITTLWPVLISCPAQDRRLSWSRVAW